MLQALGEEVLRDQGAWGGTLVRYALHWANAHAGARGLLWQVAYRGIVLAGWSLAAAPLGFTLAQQRRQSRQRRDDLSAMQHRARRGGIVLGGVSGTVLLLFWPAPLSPAWVPGWAGGIWLGLCWML